MTRAKVGDRVRVQYLGLLESGAATEKKRGRRVLEFTVGSDEVIPGISKGVEGYGAVRSRLIKEVARQRFPADLDLCVGKRLMSTGVSSGRRRRVRVLQINPHTVVVDGNHPLAGKILEVEIQLVSLISSQKDQGTSGKAK
jgi:peptidylprolyl isomerase